jgi:carbon storage regulator
MLVLSRHKNETIRINDEIVIVIVEIRGDKVRIGVDAPADVAIHRGEVYDAIKRDITTAGGSVAGMPVIGTEYCYLGQIPVKVLEVVPRDGGVGQSHVKFETRTGEPGECYAYQLREMARS